MSKLASAVLDTNVIVYDTFEDSLYHEMARELLDSLDVWVLPLIVLYEYVWLMKELGVNLEDISAKVYEYAWDPKARVTSGGKDAVRWALADLMEERLSASRFNDKVVLSVAEREGIPLATFDRGLRVQAHRVNVEVLPISIDVHES